MRATIKFKKPYHVYAPGDVATFDKSTAEVLVRQGFADHVKNVQASDKAVHEDPLRNRAWAQPKAKPAEAAKKPQAQRKAQTPPQR